MLRAVVTALALAYAAGSSSVSGGELRLVLPPQVASAVVTPADEAWATLKEIKAGTRVVVGRRIDAVAGAFAGVDGASITLSDAGIHGPTITIPRDEVTTVLGPSHRHVGQHLLRGAGIGALIGGLILAASSIEGASGGEAFAAGASFGALYGVGVGAVIGLASDPKPDVLYKRPGPAGN